MFRRLSLLAAFAAATRRDAAAEDDGRGDVDAMVEGDACGDVVGAHQQGDQQQGGERRTPVGGGEGGAGHAGSIEAVRIAAGARRDSLHLLTTP